MIDERGLTTRIEIDGGIDRDNIAELAAPELKSSSQARQFSRKGSRRRPSGLREATVSGVMSRQRLANPRSQSE